MVPLPWRRRQSHLKRALVRTVLSEYVTYIFKVLEAKSKCKMVHGLGTQAIIGIAVGSVIAGVVIIIFLTHFLRMWLRGPSLGSDCRKRLDGKVVAITGKQYFDPHINFYDHSLDYVATSPTAKPKEKLKKLEWYCVTWWRQISGHGEDFLCVITRVETWQNKRVKRDRDHHHLCSVNNNAPSFGFLEMSKFSKIHNEWSFLHQRDLKMSVGNIIYKKSHNGISWKNGIKLSCNNDLFLA